jgi:hypothetical protein
MASSRTQAVTVVGTDKSVTAAHAKLLPAAAANCRTPPAATNVAPLPRVSGALEKTPVLAKVESAEEAT